MRIMSVVGTRPQLIKEAALQSALRARHEEVFVDTGQHYDESLAGHFFGELGLPRPDHSLGIGSGSHAAQVGRIILALEPLIERHRPDAVLVFGDTNSTLAGAVAAAKLGTPVAHVEAGLRSRDRRMPEETNRIIVDHIASWCFAPTESAVQNLADEGIRSGVLEVGDVMRDLVASTIDDIRDPSVLGTIDAGGRGLGSRLHLEPGRFIFATIHRAENRSAEALEAMVALLARLGREERPVVLSLHPGTAAAMGDAGIAIDGWVHVIPPIGYRSSLALQLHAAAVVTDSGGVQRESAWLGTPCLIVRRTTEWVETVRSPGATSVIVGLDAEQADRELQKRAPMGRAPDLARARAAGLQLPSPRAAEIIAEALAQGS